MCASCSLAGVGTNLPVAGTPSARATSDVLAHLVSTRPAASMLAGPVSKSETNHEEYFPGRVIAGKTTALPAWPPRRAKSPAIHRSTSPRRIMILRLLLLCPAAEVAGELAAIAAVAPVRGLRCLGLRSAELGGGAMAVAVEAEEAAGGLVGGGGGGLRSLGRNMLLDGGAAGVAAALAGLRWAGAGGGGAIAAIAFAFAFAAAVVALVVVPLSWAGRTGTGGRCSPCSRGTLSRRFPFFNSPSSPSSSSRIFFLYLL